MGKCSIDHSPEDVRKKLAEQAEFLPAEIVGDLKEVLDKELSQEDLNEIFHLLKKYDLASEDERIVRETKLRNLL